LTALRIVAIMDNYIVKFFINNQLASTINLGRTTSKKANEYAMQVMSLPGSKFTKYEIEKH